MLKQIINIFIMLFIVLVLFVIIIIFEQSAGIIIKKILPIFQDLSFTFEKLRQNSILIDTFYFIANSLFISICFVFISFLMILIITHFILGKQSKLKCDIYELQNISKFKILWLNLLFFALLSFIVLLSYCLILKVFIYLYLNFMQAIQIFRIVHLICIVVLTCLIIEIMKFIKNIFSAELFCAYDNFLCLFN